MTYEKNFWSFTSDLREAIKVQGEDHITCLNHIIEIKKDVKFLHDNLKTLAKAHNLLASEIGTIKKELAYYQIKQEEEDE
jgi:hypothetical protein